MKFALKCSKHDKLSQLFPPNNTDASQVMNPERFQVNLQEHQDIEIAQFHTAKDY